LFEAHNSKATANLAGRADREALRRIACDHLVDHAIGFRLPEDVNL
jgi:hypothetical protein